jgi:hypothetical protein
VRADAVARSGAAAANADVAARRTDIAAWEGDKCEARRWRGTRAFKGAKALGNRHSGAPAGQRRRGFDGVEYLSTAACSHQMQS